jgi:hypothetical protein
MTFAPSEVEGIAERSRGFSLRSKMRLDFARRERLGMNDPKSRSFRVKAAATVTQRLC